MNIYREGDRLIVDLRGPGQNRRQRYLRREWSVGPYNNGVLVVILPIAAAATSKSGRSRRSPPLLSPLPWAPP